MEGDQKKSEDNEMYEATAGWDSYVSGLVAARRAVADGQPERERGKAAQAERHHIARDRTPSRRRAQLLSSGTDEPSAGDG